MSFKRGSKRQQSEKQQAAKRPKSVSSTQSLTASSKDKNVPNTKRDQQEQSRRETQTNTRGDTGPGYGKRGAKGETSKVRKGGLDVEIHPLLRDIVRTPTIPKNHNPLKNKVKSSFDPLSINPYLDQANFALAAETQHKPRPLQFNEPGKYEAQAEELRRKLREEEEEKERLQEIEKRGLKADDVLGEQHYKPVFPPSIEWWDSPFHKGSKYDDDFVVDSERAPITSYIQHPVIISPLWEQNEPASQVLHLTKKEMKRFRRNRRQEQLKEKQNRIRLGLDPPPPPKVKLSNLMNVLTNEAIKDPTAIEQRVKKETEERIKAHNEANAERQLTKDQHHEKIIAQHEKDKERGVITCVFKIKSLVNPQHMYKVDINAKQLHLVGLCIKNPEFNLIVVEGGRKSIEFYKKLLTKRIKWTEYQPPKLPNNDVLPEEMKDIDLSHNTCDKIWEGQLTNTNFKKWSVIETQDQEDLQDLLLRFKLGDYWRMALTHDN